MRFIVNLASVTKITAATVVAILRGNADLAQLIERVGAVETVPKALGTIDIPVPNAANGVTGYFEEETTTYWA